MKNTHSGRNVILLYIIFLILASCKIETYDIIKETPVEVIDTETDEPIIQEVQTMELQSIKEYKNYVTSGKRVFGIDRDRLEEIKLLDVEDKPIPFNKFFVIDGEICLSVMVTEQGEEISDTVPVQYESIQKEYFFVQSSGDMMEVEKSAFFNIPESVRIEYTHDGMFGIEKSIYGELETSTVIRGTVQEAHIRIDGCARVHTGMWFSSAETYKNSAGTGIRLKGVYFWPDNAVKSRVIADGRIW